MRTLAVAAVALLLSGAAVASPFDGKWTLNPKACSNADRDDGLATIADKKITYWESECTITKIAPIGEGDPASVWRVETACSGEGENWTKDSVFAIDRDAEGAARQLVEIEMNEGYVVVLQACK
jgi:hypothetical protein